MAKKKPKAFADMSVREIYALESRYGVQIGGNRPVVPSVGTDWALPQKPWRIVDFFVAAAVRKGITDLPEWLNAKDTQRLIQQNLKDYRIDWYFDNKSKYPSSFTIHCDGSWIYAKGPKVVHGKLQPPHAKGWVEKMITKGTPGEYARADWDYYFKLRNLK